MNQRARLHVVHTEASLGWGGQEIRILTEARGLIARGHEIELLCPAERGLGMDHMQSGALVHEGSAAAPRCA